MSISKQKSFVYWPNFQRRFWAKLCLTDCLWISTSPGFLHLNLFAYKHWFDCDLKNVCKKKYFTPFYSAICRNTLLLMTADFFFMIWWIVLLLTNIPQIQIFKSTYSPEKNESCMVKKSESQLGNIAYFLTTYTILDSNKTIF